MGILDNAIHLGVESTYGTPASLTRSFEGKADTFKREQAQLDSVGFRAAMEAVRSDRVVQVNMGGAGSLELDVMDKGMGLLLSGLLGTEAGPTQQSTTTAYLQTFTTSSDGPSKSYTIQVVRDIVGGSTQQFTHHGCQPTGWSLRQNAGELLTLTVDFDFEDVDTSTGAGTPTYVASQTPFAWTQCLVEVASTAYDARSVEFSADLGMKTDRRYLRQSELKSQPIRAAMPSYSGTLVLDFEATTHYAAWLAGTVQQVDITWTGSLIESTYYHELKLTLPAVQFTGESPEASLSELTTQSLPFRVLDDGTNPVATLTYQSTDTSF